MFDFGHRVHIQDIFSCVRIFLADFNKKFHKRKHEIVVIILFTLRCCDFISH